MKHMRATIKQSQDIPRPERRKISDINDEELERYPVSEHSEFKDESWFFVNPTPGSRADRSTINWKMRLFDGSELTDVRHAKRLHWAKMLVLSLILIPAGGRKLAPGSMSLLQRQLRWLLSWMSQTGYHHPNELAPAVVRHYLDQLPAILAARSDDKEIGEATATIALMALIHLWNQRQALAKMGLESLPRHPFEGIGAHAVAKGLATKATGWIPPLPDEVTIPLLNKATWFLGTPAEDVLRLLDAVCAPLTSTKDITEKSEVNSNLGPKRSGKNAKRLTRTIQFLETFKFGIPDGDSKPWHQPLDLGFEQSQEGLSPRIARVKVLWETVRDAAMIMVQATSGMRLSELLGILAGTDEASGLPKGVRVELSGTGLYEWFVIRSQLSKTEEGSHREVDWVLGMRPVGNHGIPLAVRALQILERLHAPWRATAHTDRLILVGRQSISLPIPSTCLDAMPIDRANEGMQRFITRWLDLSSLPDESARKTEDNDLVRWRENKGKMFRTHMLRKTWAQFSLACDSRLLPAIQMQFHHMNLAMTESGYIGSNPLLLSELNCVSVQKTNLTVFELIVGKSKLAGRMGEQLEQALTKLRAEVGELPISEKWQKAVEWVEMNDLKMFFTAHATCAPTRTSEMRCHDASDTPVWLRKTPNTATREPSVCAGCSCAIMDKSHEPFWSDRYVRCEVSVRQAEATGIPSSAFREIRFRAEQARVIIKRFGADLEALDLRVASIIESNYAKT